MKHLYMLAAVISMLSVALFPSTNEYELCGFIGVSMYLTWNLYAFLNGRRMFPPMNYKIDFSAGGDKAARTYLATLCLILLAIVNVIWIGQRTA
ncbi:hypothetical protein [Hydrogenophaga sp.]|uniref:hypothetical protein n=1 Tax=Hydrogenophaga sp. TaxID=1904254 RepID=UPI003D0DB04D